MNNKKLTDEEVLKLVEDFYKLSESEKSKKHLGSGAFKDAYEVHPDYVLKEPRMKDTGSINQMFSDYMSSKETGRYVPVEQPMLVLREGKHPVHLQKKLKSSDMENLNDNLLKNKSDEFKNILKEKQIDSRFSDISPVNMGLDELGNAKIYDPLGPIYESSSPRGTPAFLSKQNALKRLSAMTGNKVYRALPFIGPALAGAAAISSQDASAAIPLLSEAESIGQSPEDEKQMLAEIEAQKNYDKSPAKLARLQKLLNQK
jgi:hypothetical protein